MESDMRKIHDIKQQVKQLIQDNLHREVTPEKKHNISGIYMIYIDKFSSEKVVPIYIGQAKNIQRRYKQHYCEILALNRLSYEEYYTYFFSKSHSFYEGHFKTCKIFKYMLENECTLKDCVFRTHSDTHSGNIRTLFRYYPDSISAHPDTLSS